jgi:hypothetical protein
MTYADRSCPSAITITNPSAAVSNSASSWLYAIPTVMPKTRIGIISARSRSPEAIMASATAATYSTKSRVNFRRSTNKTGLRK